MVRQTGRANQKRRTRKALLEAAAKLMRDGKTPSLDDVAEEALVSRATAYRYFSSVEPLLVEAALDVVIPDAGVLFDDDSTKDPIARLERVDRALDESIASNEAALRTVIAFSAQRPNGGDGDIPPRQNRRTPLIEEALKPARADMSARDYDYLCKALALVMGGESMIVFKDVLQISDTEARRIKKRMIRTLVESTLKG